jgi:hypothetical protein
LIREQEGKRPLGRPRHRWKDNVKMHLKEMWVGNCGLDLFNSFIVMFVGPIERTEFLEWLSSW